MNLRLSAELVRRLDLGAPLGPAGLLVPARLAALAPQAVLACLAYPTAWDLRADSIRPPALSRKSASAPPTVQKIAGRA